MCKGPEVSVPSRLLKEGLRGRNTESSRARTQDEAGGRSGLCQAEPPMVGGCTRVNGQPLQGLGRGRALLFLRLTHSMTGQF